MPELELDQDPGGEKTKGAKEDDDDDAGDEADDCEGGREGKHAIADDFGDHEYGDEFP